MPKSSISPVARAARIVLALVAARILDPTAAPAADVPLFADDFETGDACRWSAQFGAEPCDDCFGQLDGTPCGSTEYSGCGACNYIDSCDQEGTQTCDCTTYTCQLGICEPAVDECERECSRVTDGDTCGAQSCGGGLIRDLCCAEGTCSQVCSTCYCVTCRAPFSPRDAPSSTTAPRWLSLPERL